MNKLINANISAMRLGLCGEVCNIDSTKKVLAFSPTVVLIIIKYM
jgi:hypothetical protein